MNRKYIVLMLLALAFVSCTKVLDIDDTAGRQLVVNAEPMAGRQAFVNMSYTRFFLDNNNDQPINGANLTLYVNGTPYTSDSIRHCNYYFGYTLQPGDSLVLDAVAPDGRQAHAATYVPLLPDITGFNVNYRRTPVFNYLSVNFNLSDHSNVDEIYSIAVQVRDSGARFNEWLADFDTVDTLHYTYFCLPGAPDITDNDVCPYIPMVEEPFMLYGSRIMFLDRRIAGRQDMPVTLLIPLLRDTNEVEPFKHEYVVTFKSVTPARYRYTISAASQGGSVSMFAEQGQAYGNVDGALGIFAGSAGYKYRFDKDSVMNAVGRGDGDVKTEPSYGVFDMQKLEKFCRF